MARIPLSVLKPRPLPVVVNEFTAGNKVINRALAEEAIAAVAKDRAIDASEYSKLLGFDAGLVPLYTRVPTDAAGWQKGTTEGRALFSALARHVRQTYEAANPNAPRTLQNPFLFWAPKPTGLRPIGPAPVSDYATLVKKLRADTTGHVRSAADRLVAQYPKAQHRLNTYQSTIKPAVEARIDALVNKWKAGTLRDENDLTAPLKRFLDANYR